MSAGMNARATVWRITFPTDDDVGGAVATGTPIYNDVTFRIQANLPDQAFLQQGLETLRTFDGFCRPGTLLIYERDEVEITWPLNHRYYGERFRVAGVTESDFHPNDARAYLILSLTRSEKAHGNV